MDDDRPTKAGRTLPQVGLTTGGEARRPPRTDRAAGQTLADPAPSALDREAGFDIGDDFTRFSQKDDIFCRSFWDPRVRSHRSDMFYETYRTPKLTWRKADGFTQRDYACATRRGT